MVVKMSVEQIRHIQLMIGTPVYGSQCYGLYLRSILSLQRKCHKVGIQMMVSNICHESLLQRSRNYVVDEFLRSGFTHLMFVDTDICFDPDYVIALLMLDKDVIGAPYPEKKKIEWETVIRGVQQAHCQETDLEKLAGDLVMDDQHKQTIMTDPSTLIKVDVLKPGFMMVKRRVFDKLQMVYPENSYRPDHIGIAHFDGARNIHMFFSVEIDPDTRKLLTEYEFFCKQWRDIGGQIYMCPWMVLTHIGTHMY